MQEMDRQKQMEDLFHVRVKAETTDDQFPVGQPAAGGGAELPEEEEPHKYEPNVQLMSVSKEKVLLEQSEWRPSLEQDLPPELLHIKEEQEELSLSQEEDQLHGLEEADIIKFTFTPAPLKSEEDDEEKPQSSQLHQTEEIKTEANEDNCEGPEPDKNFNTRSNLKPFTDDETSHSSEPETDDSFNWEDTSGVPSDLNPLRNNEESNAGKTPVCSSECVPSFSHKIHLQEHSGIQSGVKPFCCSVCGKKYISKASLTAHRRLHSVGISCSVCKKAFPSRGLYVRHMRVHTGEKPFSCLVCSTRFTRNESLTEHMRIHSGEKPFSCSICGSRFTRKQCLRDHMRIHTGEKPFSCSVCGTKFTQKQHLTRHLCIHSGEKPFICSVCDKSFSRLIYLKKHTCAVESSGSK